MPPYIGLNRKITEWEYHQENATVNMLIHFLALSSETATVVRGIEIAQGQLVTSRSELCEMFKITDRQARTCLEHLKKSGLIAVDIKKKLTVISILKSELYVLKKAAATVLSAANAEQPTNQTTNQTTNLKSPQTVMTEEKTDCKKIETTNQTTKKSGGKQRTNYSKPPAYTPEFERFWEQYPNHKNKRDAFKAWGQVNPSGEVQEKILYDLSTRQSRGDWLEAKYIPMAGTYLRGWRWEDETKQSAAPQKQTGYYNPMFEYAEQLKRMEENG